ncbi:hypothetical protein C4J89_2636 [Pseudomonas sp. R4-35-07]|nr:hypothetical protein C4J90_2587 [Pseudomonas sp. R2-60-08W]AZF32111.1 hypothetical protein C4J89_2636 [Pseudomonas sp. R4-35-07]
MVVVEPTLPSSPAPAIGQPEVFTYAIWQIAPKVFNDV